MSTLQFSQYQNKPLVDWAEETSKSTPTFGTVSLVSALWSLFEVATDVLLFMQSKTTETTSRALCDPHSADLKVQLVAKFNRGQKYIEGTAITAHPLQSGAWITDHLKVSRRTGDEWRSISLLWRGNLCGFFDCNDIVDTKGLLLWSVAIPLYSIKQLFYTIMKQWWWTTAVGWM